MYNVSLDILDSLKARSNDFEIQPWFVWISLFPKLQILLKN